MKILLRICLQFAVWAVAGFLGMCCYALWLWCFPAAAETLDKAGLAFRLETFALVLAVGSVTPLARDIVRRTLA